MEKINTIELVEAIFVELRKHRSGAYFPEAEINRLIASAELGLFNYFRANFEMNQQIVEHLQPFIINDKLIDTDNSGILTLPSDYAYRGAITGLYLENPAEGGDTVVKSYPCFYLDAGEFVAIQSDHIVYPSRKKKRFYHTISHKGMEVLPREKVWTKINYIRYPVPGTIHYIITEVDGQDKIEYDTATSTNMEWNKITYPLFFFLLCSYFGISIKDPYVMQYKDLPKIS